MKRKSIFTYCKRVFLNPVTTDQKSYIHATVESSGEGDYKYGSNLIAIADCKRQIRLEFFLGRARDRQLSLKKINLLIDVITQFPDALMREIMAIEKSKK